jgi:thioredoxin reductase (NADPH)
MSQYLVDRIRSLPNVDVVVGSEVSALDGQDGKLNSVLLKYRGSGDERLIEASFLFSFIGAEPNTDWLAGSGLQLDKIGFVLTGSQAGGDRFPLETSRRGIFAVGDVRSGSVKRVASSVGDGAQVVAAIHAYLAASGEMEARPRPMASPALA